MSGFPGRVAVVTGAGSGIGRGLALGLARRGARLAICDIDEAGLAETAARAEQFGAKVLTARVDVSDAGAVAGFADEVVARFGVVNQVYNNAGIAFNKTILDSDLEQYERVLGVNLWGVIHGTKAFLPHLIASGEGHVVNISSLNGFMAQSEMSHYCASKFAVRGFTETLRAEMTDARHPVSVTCVHPGGVRTEIATNALELMREGGLPITAADEARRRVYNEKLLRMSPDRAADIILEAVARDRPRVLVGSDAKGVDLGVRAFPALYPRVAATVMKVILATGRRRARRPMAART
ncbi:MAG TPA: SDR family NAD(P)-dependent oxidoreductase [Solirubrobacteraceae bacterium]|nr:SDR family NAD(P)-dependent oxidoreductase [Solirubrobacteraceae bacterium]